MKTLLSWFLLWLEVLELFSIRKAFLFVIKDWKWKYFWAKSTNRHNNVMQFFPPYLHTVIQPILWCPAALRTYFTIVFLYSLLCNLEDVILWPASFIINSSSAVNSLKSSGSWWQNIMYIFTAALCCRSFLCFCTTTLPFITVYLTNVPAILCMRLSGFLMQWLNIFESTGVKHNKERFWSKVGVLEYNKRRKWLRETGL